MLAMRIVVGIRALSPKVAPGIGCPQWTVGDPKLTNTKDHYNWNTALIGLNR